MNKLRIPYLIGYAIVVGSFSIQAQTPPEATRLETPLITRSGKFQWTWLGAEEGTYAVEHLSEFGNPDWNIVGFRQANGGEQIWDTEKIKGTQQGFYRLSWRPPGESLSIEFDIHKPGPGNHPQNWFPLFADYPAAPDQEAMFDLIAEPRPLPVELGGEPAFFLGGSNRSDDLFMGLYRPIEGLAPDTTYETTLSVTLASNIPTGLVGIGGSPGDSVYVKGGVSTEEPNREIVDEWWRPTVDKGNQFSNGSEGVTLGTIAKPADGNDQWVLIERTTGRKPIIATTNPEGQLWTFVGTDSGFEGRTEIYFHSVTVTLSPAL